MFFSLFSSSAKYMEFYAPVYFIVESVFMGDGGMRRNRQKMYGMCMLHEKWQYVIDQPPHQTESAFNRNNNNNKKNGKENVRHMNMKKLSVYFGYLFDSGKLAYRVITKHLLLNIIK